MVHIKFGSNGDAPASVKRKFEEMTNGKEEVEKKLKKLKQTAVKTFSELEDVPQDLKEALDVEFEFTDMTEIQVI